MLTRHPGALERHGAWPEGRAGRLSEADPVRDAEGLCRANQPPAIPARFSFTSKETRKGRDINHERS